MNCKNCLEILKESDNYCPNCGGRNIRNRLTFLGLAEQFGEQFLNYDNKFLKTLIHLFTKPQNVINGYISGVRKRYVNPMTYYAIALTLSGILLFTLRKFFEPQMSMDWMMTNNKKIEAPSMDAMFEFQGILALASIPIYAVLSKIMFFKNKAYNFAEHMIINLYLFAQYSIVLFPVSLIFLLFGANYFKLTYIALFFQILYVAYCLKKVMGLTTKKIVIKTLLFFLFLLILFIIPVVIGVIFTIVLSK